MAAGAMVDHAATPLPEAHFVLLLVHSGVCVRVFALVNPSTSWTDTALRTFCTSGPKQTPEPAAAMLAGGDAVVIQAPRVHSGAPRNAWGVCITIACVFLYCALWLEPAWCASGTTTAVGMWLLIA